MYIPHNQIDHGHDNVIQGTEESFEWLTFLTNPTQYDPKNNRKHYQTKNIHRIPVVCSGWHTVRSLVLHFTLHRNVVRAVKQDLCVGVWTERTDVYCAVVVNDFWRDGDVLCFCLTRKEKRK